MVVVRWAWLCCNGCGCVLGDVHSNKARESNPCTPHTRGTMPAAPESDAIAVVCDVCIDYLLQERKNSRPRKSTRLILDRDGKVRPIQHELTDWRLGGHCTTCAVKIKEDGVKGTQGHWNSNFCSWKEIWCKCFRSIKGKARLRLSLSLLASCWWSATQTLLNWKRCWTFAESSKTTQRKPTVSFCSLLEDYSALLCDVTCCSRTALFILNISCSVGVVPGWARGGRSRIGLSKSGCTFLWWFFWVVNICIVTVQENCSNNQ